eukprot:3939720-Rhodomonas_salina.1
MAHKRVISLPPPPTGITSIVVYNVEKWHTSTKKWFTEETGSPVWHEQSFHMRLRRAGFKPINKSPRPATNGWDYGLKRHDVAIHAFVFDQDTYKIYNRTNSDRKERAQNRPLPPQFIPPKYHYYPRYPYE